MLEIDDRRRKAMFNKRELVLQDKAWQVLQLIYRAHPGSISRHALIERIWGGNALTGEKGLNQALWAIRNQLGDNARDPRCIRTLPRRGYLWMDPPHTSRHKRWLYGVAAAAVLAICSALLFVETESAPSEAAYTLPARCDLNKGAQAHAYRRDRNVVIVIEDICHLVVTPTGNKEFGKPIISSDGHFVAFEVKENQSCKLVTFALQNGRRAEFEQCAELSSTSPT